MAMTIHCDIVSAEQEIFSGLAELVDTVPVAANARHYARIIHDKACLRQLIKKSNEIAVAEVDDFMPFGPELSSNEDLYHYKKKNIKLVLQGFKHPDENQKLSMEARKTLDFIDKYKLEGKNIFITLTSINQYSY